MPGLLGCWVEFLIIDHCPICPSVEGKPPGSPRVSLLMLGSLALVDRLCTISTIGSCTGHNDDALDGLGWSLGAAIPCCGSP